MLEGTAKGYKFVVVRVMELWQLAHAISFNILTVRNAIFLIFIALALVSRLFIFLFLIVTSLIEQWWIRIVQYMLGVGAYFAQSVNEALSCLVYLGISVVKHVVLTSGHIRVVIIVRAQVDLLPFLTI